MTNKNAALELVLDHYRQHTTNSDPGRYAALYDALPDNLAARCVARCTKRSCTCSGPARRRTDSLMSS